MGERGKPPTPTAMKLAQGTYRRSRDGPVVAGGLPPFEKPPAAPRALGSHGKSEWKKVAKWLVEMGVLTPSDVGLLERYCRTFDEVSRLDVEIEKDGSTYIKHNGDIVPHPGVRERFQWFTIRKECEKLLGLTPTARCDVPMQEKKKEEEFKARSRA